MKRVATNTNLEDISDFDEQQQRKLKKKNLNPLMPNWSYMGNKILWAITSKL